MFYHPKDDSGAASKEYIQNDYCRNEVIHMSLIVKISSTMVALEFLYISLWNGYRVGKYSIR